MGKHFRKSQVPATEWASPANRESSAGKHAKKLKTQGDNDPARDFVDMLVSNEEPGHARSFVDRLVSSEQPDRTTQGPAAEYKKRMDSGAAHWSSEARVQGADGGAQSALEQRLRNTEQQNKSLLEDLAVARNENARLQAQAGILTRQNMELGNKLRSMRLMHEALENDNAKFRVVNARLNERLKELEATVLNQTVLPTQAKRQLARVLHGHFERAASRLFGSVESPAISVLSCERAEALKTLHFGDNSHPNCYENEDANALYCVKYEMGYAFEYYFVYSHLLADLTGRFGRTSGNHPLGVVSVGSGQDLDLWGLMYALASLRREEDRNMPVQWTGVDLEVWPGRIFDQTRHIPGVNHVTADIRDYLVSLDGQMPATLVFPKSISELPPDAIQAICDWISKARLTYPTHCIAIVHTDINNMDVSGCTYDSRSKDAVKAARIIDAFSAACENNGFKVFRDSGGHHDGHVASVGAYYRVAKPERGHSRSASYEYAHFGNLTGWFGDYYQNDPAFSPFSRRTYGQYVAVFDVAQRLFECCHNWQADKICSPSGRFVNCNSTSCRRKQSCPLQRYPRVKLGSMAYQIVYGSSHDTSVPTSTNPDAHIPF